MRRCFVSFILPGLVTLATASAPSVVWTFNATNTVMSSPAIGPDGTIYFGVGRVDLNAVTPDGTMKWRYRRNESTPPTSCLAPAVAEDGTVYAGFYDVFVALTPDGLLKWKYPNTTSANFDGRGAALAADGSIFVAPAGQVLKLAPGGTPSWAALTINAQGGWPVLSTAEVIY